MYLERVVGRPMLGKGIGMVGSKAIVAHTRSPIAIGVDRTERQKLYS